MAAPEVKMAGAATAEGDARLVNERKNNTNNSSTVGRDNKGDYNNDNYICVCVCVCRSVYLCV